MRVPRSNSGNRPYPGKPVPKPKVSRAESQGDRQRKQPLAKVRTAVSQTKEEYKISVSAPGLIRENLMVSINEDANLHILFLEDKADPRHQGPKDTAASSAIFSKVIVLPPDVDSEFVSATCHSGTLKIIFRKVRHPVKNKPHHISVY